MDWSRTKSILILALVLTNGILFYVLYGDKLTSADYEKQQQTQLSEVIELLQSEEIYITTEIPTKSRILSDIRLTYETYEDENVVANLLGEGYQKSEGRYLTKDAEVRILGGQDLVYKLLNVSNEAVDTDVEKAKALAKAFLENKGFNDTSVAYWNTKKLDNGTVVVEYRQVEEGYFLENAYMTMLVSRDKVVEFRRKWFGAIVILETNKVVESPLKALFRLLPEIDSSETIERPVKIESMDLGYRLVSNILTINFKEGEPSPFWRFRTSSGEVIYIEAQIE